MTWWHGFVSTSIEAAKRRVDALVEDPQQPLPLLAAEGLKGCIDACAYEMKPGMAMAVISHGHHDRLGAHWENRAHVVPHLAAISAEGRAAVPDAPVL